MTKLLQAVLYVGGLLVLTKCLQVAGQEIALPWWVFAPQGWLIVIALLVCWFLGKQRPSNHAIVFALAFPVAVAMVSFWGSLATEAPVETWQDAVDNWYFEVNLVRAGDLGLMLMYATLFAVVTIFWPIERADLVGMGMAGILWAGEPYMLAEHFLCNFVWPVEGSAVILDKMAGTDAIYACSRADLSWLIWASPVVQIAIMLALAVLLVLARERNAKAS